MKTFFDSSAFAKRFIQEKGSDIVEDICLNTTNLAISILCISEIISALNRRFRENKLTKSHYLLVKERLLEEIKDTIILNITPNVVNKSIDLLENNQLRAMDSLHVACAIEWKTELFVSSDQKQIEAAQKAGLNIHLV